MNVILSSEFVCAISKHACANKPSFGRILKTSIEIDIRF